MTPSRPPSTSATPESRALAVADRDEWTMSRRAFLGAVAATGSLAVLPDWMQAEAAGAALGSHDGVLVVVTMDGGNDGLSTVVPFNDGHYRDRRGAMARSAGATLPISGSRGLHPNLGYLKNRWDAGKLAVIDGVGHPRTVLSHFSAMADVMNGGPSSGTPTSGWVGRYLDGLGGNAYAGISIGQDVPLIARGANVRSTTLPATSEFVPVRSGVRSNQYQALAEMGAGTTGRGALADQIADLDATLIGRADALRGHYQADALGPMARELDLAARLINANIGTRVLTISHMGYDTHANQPHHHDTRMAELDAGLRQFFARLSSTYRSRVLVLVLSEFGRRVQANGSVGTDHGNANTMFAVGEPVRGGFYGALPSLGSLTADGNLKTVLDYRQVLAPVLDLWLDADAKQVLGVSHGNLGFFVRPGQSPTPGVFPTTFRSAHADVLRLYRAFFGREPDARGAEYWVGVMDDGRSLDAIAEYFIGSPEFDANYRGTSDTEYLRRVYRNVLGRSYDESGFRYWLGELRSGRLTRAGVVRWVAASPEFVKKHPYHAIPI